MNLRPFGTILLACKPQKSILKFGLEHKSLSLVQNVNLFDSYLPIWACPDFWGGSLKFLKPNLRKKRALVRENRRFDPLGLRQKQGSGQKISGGGGVVLVEMIPAESFDRQS